jgi:hypothetical protein
MGEANMPKPKKVKLEAGHKRAIEFIMGRVHIGTSDADIELDMRRRAKKMGASEGLTEALVSYALAEHQRNQQEYNAVMGGNLGAMPKRKR